MSDMISATGRTCALPSGMSSHTTSAVFQRALNLAGIVVCPLLEMRVFTIDTILYQLGQQVKEIGIRDRR